MKPVTRRSNLSRSTKSTIAGTACPTTIWEMSLTRWYFASISAFATTSANLRSAISFWPITSSREPAGIHWISSTHTMCSCALCEWASRNAADRALNPPSDPSLAIRIFLNMDGLLDDRLECGLEPVLCDHGRHDGAGNYRRHQDRVLLLVDDAVGKAEQSGDRAECQPCAHHQRRVHSLAPVKFEDSGERKNTDELGDHLHEEEDGNKPDRRANRFELHARAGLQKIERREDREGDGAEALGQGPLFDKESSERHAEQIGRKHGLALRHGSEGGQRKQDEQHELGLGLAHAAPETLGEPRHDL